MSTCPDPAPCACAANEECIQISRDCQQCAQTKCVAQTTSSSEVSKGALIGGIIGALAFLAMILFLFFLYRRRVRLRKTRELKKDIPASAETVLNRPDPTEKLSSVIYSTTPIEPQAQSSLLPPTGNNSSQLSHTNPFEDTNSIQTAGTEGTNVIPIALVPNRASTPNSESPSLPSSASSFPLRPIRSPELNLNLDPTSVSNGTQRVGYSKSLRSGISSRYSYHSYMSNASSASDLLNEAPMIMTPMKGSIRQVVGAAKAEVINADSLSSSGGSSDGLSPPAYTPKSSVKSPLASTSFGPDDVVSEADETLDSADPFGEESTSIRTTTSAQAHYESTENGSTLNGLNPPSSISNVTSRPSSMATQAGSVINISSATRVAIASSPTGTAVPRRTTMGRLVTPPASVSSLQEQQQRALAHAHAQAQAQGLDTRRMSGSSALSATSTRADSILESFPFVPPSPISDRPIRSPPVSPLSQQSFVNPSSSSLHQQTLVVSPPSPLSHQSFTAEPNTTTVPKDSLKLPPPPDRQTLGLSTGSRLSTASSGLSSFPFQIESESVADPSSRPSTLNGRKRASLDTLALTTALSSYPLGFDRGNAYPPKK